jgi:hypothetical protein
MTGEAALTHRLVFKYKWPALRGVALEARLVLAQERNAAAFERLLDVRGRALHRHAHVRIVAISTTHFPFQHRVVMRKLETCAYLEVTLETRFR